MSAKCPKCGSEVVSDIPASPWMRDNVHACDYCGFHFTDWQQGEIERLMDANGKLIQFQLQAVEEIDKLRGLLRRLEWRIERYYEYGKPEIVHSCPVCDGDLEHEGHKPGCELAAAIGEK